ncbi:MAG: hypothetical protein FOGNACKC_00840 [Anaerolineae bacterium]|nr:hypothetical protein [Anaerolineae bacterium]
MSKNPLHDPFRNDVFIVINTSRGPHGYPYDGRAYAVGDEEPVTHLGEAAARGARNDLRREHGNPEIEMYRLVPAGIEILPDGTWQYLPRPNCPVCGQPVEETDEAGSSCGAVLHDKCMERHLADCEECMETHGEQCDECGDWFGGAAERRSVELYARCPACQQKYLRERYLSPEFFPLSLRGIGEPRAGVEPFPFMLATSLAHASRMARDYALIYGDVSAAVPLVGIYQGETMLAQIDKDGVIYARPVGVEGRDGEAASWVMVSQYAYHIAKNRAYSPEEMGHE